MNEDLKYQEYLSNGGTLPYEEYISAATLFSQIESVDEDLKKKDQPTENGTPSLTTGIPPSQTDLNPTIPNQIPENEFMVPMGSEQDLSLPSSGITAEMPSTDLPSTNVASSGTEGSNVNLPTATQPALSNVGISVLPTIQKPTTPLDILAGKSNNIQGDIKPTPSSQAELDADTAKNNFEANQLKIDAQKSSNDFIDQYKNKDYIRTKVAEFNPDKPLWIDKNAVDLDSETYVNQILEREKRGEVTVARNNEGQIIDKDSQPITDNNNILWQPKGKYVDEYNATVRDFNTQVGEQNVDSARFNQGNIGNEPEQDGFREFASIASKFGVLPTTEEYANLTTTEQRNDYLATAEATQNAQKNGTTFQEEYDKVIPKYALTEQVKIANGFEALNLLNGGLESGSAKDKSESDFFNNYFTDKNNVMQFGEYWNNEGKAKYQSSQVMENQANYQAHRAKIWNDYLSYQNDKLGTDMRFIEEAVVNASALADKYVLSGDMASAQKEIDKVNSLSEQYSNNEAGMIAVSNLYSESNKNFTQLQKQKKQETDIQLKVENGDLLSNVGNILGQIPLGIATSVNSTISGVGRILSSAIPSDNLKDALDIMSATDLKVGNVKVASLSNKIVDFVGSDGYKYREINGKTYGINNDGKLFATKYNRGQNDKVEKESVDYNWGSGLAFVTSKMMTDIVLTTAVGGGINKGLASASSRIANSKNIATVFGEGSQLAKSAESFARLAKNADNVSVSGWYVQMYNDSYQMAERGGIKGELNKSLYAITQSFMQSVIQRINPDINFLKSMNDESRQIVRALMTNEKDKAVQLISAFVKKTGNNVLKETGEELVQQVTQDINNIVINKIGKTNLETTDGQGYKEVVFGTVIPSAVASLMGGKGSRIANINNKEIDLTTYSRNELVTELARDKNGVDLIKDFRNTAYFQSQKDFAQDIANEITERQKYISKVPEVEKYSTPALSEVAPILQQIEKKKEDLKKDDGTFAERINKDIAELTTQANAILDNDLTQNNESPNAETAQPTPQSEAVQEQTPETQQPQVATESEQPTITGEQNIPSELNPTQDGQTTVETQKADIEKRRKGELNVPDRTNILNAAVVAQDAFPNETLEQLQKRLQEEIEYINVLVKKLKEKGIPDEKIIKQIKDYISNGNRVISRREGVSDFATYLVENNTQITSQEQINAKYDAELEQLNTQTNGQTTAEIQNPTAEAEENVQPSNQAGQDTANQLPEMGEGIAQSENVTQEVAPQEEVNEDDIVLADDTLDLINSLTDETTPSDNTGNDGNTESATGIIQKSEPTGQENPQGVSTTADIGTGEGNAEVENRFISKLGDRKPYQLINQKLVENNNNSNNVELVYEDVKHPKSISKYPELQLFSFRDKDGTFTIAENVYGSGKIVSGKKTIKEALDALEIIVQKNGVEGVAAQAKKAYDYYNRNYVQQTPAFSDNEQAKTLNENPNSENNTNLAQDKAENDYAESKTTTEDNPEQEPVVKTIESTGRNKGRVSTKKLAETEKTATKLIDEAIDVKKMNLSRLSTDEKRFQGRKKLNQTVVDNIAENFSPKDQDPIHIWKDPKSGKYFVLSGHHRYYGAKKAGVTHVKVIDRTSDYTEAQAIKFAKEEANANRSMETPLERASTLRQKRERGDSKEEINAFLNAEGKNKRLVENLSHLNPKGKTAQSTEQFDTVSNSDSKRETEKLADWIGEARKLFGERLTDAHENEMYDFLNNKEASKRFTNKADFIEKVRNLVGTLDYDATQPLNLKRVQQKGEGEREYEKQMQELKDQSSDYERQITELDKRFTDATRADYINPNSTDFAQVKELATKERTRLRKEQESVFKKINALQMEKGKYVKADINQGNLFDFQSTDKTFTPIPQSTYDKLVKRLLGVFKKFGGKVITTKAEVDAKLKEFGVADYMIKAFHGSPHRFDRFSTEFMGSGEGNQAFGWGLYFTDLKGIAENYAKIGNRELSFEENELLQNILYDNDNDVEKAKNEIQKRASEIDKYNNLPADKYAVSLNDKIKNGFNPSSNLYNVSLHEGKTPEQYSWLEWDKPLNKKAQKLIDESGILNTEETLTDTEKERVFERDNEWFINGVYGSKYKTQEQALSALRNVLNKPILTANQFYGEGLYKKLSSILGGDKQASLFLLENGIDGIKYPAESISRGATSDNARGFNYVVFDENAVTIDEVVEFMKTKDGEIYGAKFPDGTIYLNPEKVNANTPIHEFSHLWQQLMPTRFKKGVELLKNTPIGKKTFADLRANEGYENKSDDELWNEAMVTVMGNEGERIFNSSRASKLKEWLTDLFKALGNAFGIRDLSPNDKLSTFVKGALSEVMGTKEIIPESSVEQKEVPIYIKKMSNTDLRGMLDKLGLVMDAVCP